MMGATDLIQNAHREAKILRRSFTDGFLPTGRTTRNHTAS